MTGGEEQSEGEPTSIMFEDVAKVLDNSEPADLSAALEKVFDQRRKESNQAKARRLNEQAERMLREIPEGDLDEVDKCIRCIIDYFREYDPEPLLSRLISGRPLSHAERLLLASAMAGLATEDGGHYGRVLKKVPNRRGRPHGLLTSEEIMLWVNRVKEAKITEKKKTRAVAKVAEEYKISQRKLWDILRHEEWARKFYEPDEAEEPANCDGAAS
jgi:hypothetical protein